jgi:ABC-type antimicrobial peptide transport system permease subunit
MIHGNKEQVLANKTGIALSKRLAFTLFGTTENLIGKTIEWHRKNFNEYVPKDFDGSYLITGIFENPPLNSTLQFDVLFSYDLCLEKYPELNEWSNGSGNPNTYVVLKEGADAEQFNKKIAGYLQSKQKDSDVSLFIRKYSDQYLYGKYENGVQAGGRIQYIHLFTIIALFILSIACINFMNLSTAKASGRLKEIGIKKTIGAGRKTLLFQFLFESMLMALLASLIAIVFVYLLLPQFNSVTGKELRLLLSSDIILPLLLITIVTGCVAGSYPALYLSRFKLTAIFKAKTSPAGSDAMIRKGLVVFQFTVSIILIVGVLIVNKQVGFIQSKSLGYNKDNIVYLEKGGEVKGDRQSDMETFIRGLKTLPGVENAANLGYDITGSNGTTSSLVWEGKNPGDKTEFHMLHAGYNLIETLGFKLTAGRTFSKDFGPSEKSKIILNEAAIETMKLTDPIGKVVTMGSREYEIIGVVKNFNFESIYEKVKPCYFDLIPTYSNVVVKISAGREKETLDRLQEFYKQYVGFSLNFKFLDEQYQKMYESENRLAVLSRFFAGLAILISCLGLFGLSAFTTEKRFKEIGVRKVLGATISQIVLLLTRDFILLVLIAILIGFPVAIWAANNWMQDFAYKAEIAWWIYVVAAVAAILIALLTVSFQAIKASIANPVKSLRTE